MKDLDCMERIMHQHIQNDSEVVPIKYWIFCFSTGKRKRHDINYPRFVNTIDLHYKSRLEIFPAALSCKEFH